MRRRISLTLVVLAAWPLGYAWPQNDGKNFEEVKPPVVFGEGFYGLEKYKDSTWRWLGDNLPKEGGPVPLKGSVHLLNSKKDSELTIAGAIPKESAGPTIKLFLNGELLDEFTAAKDRFEKTYKVPAAKQGQDEYSELLITVDKFAIPSENNKNSQDIRRLALRLTKLNWGEHGGMVRAAEPPILEAPGVVQPDALPPYRWLTMVLVIGLVPFALVLSLAVFLALRARRSNAHAAAGDAKQEKGEDVGAAVRFPCSNCGKSVKVKAELEGMKVKCPHCRQAVIVARP